MNNDTLFYTTEECIIKSVSLDTSALCVTLQALELDYSGRTAEVQRLYACFIIGTRLPYPPPLLFSLNVELEGERLPIGVKEHQNS